MKTSAALFLTGALAAVTAQAQDLGLTSLGSFDASQGNAEILAYTPFGNTLLSTGNSGVQIFDFDGTATANPRAFVDFSGAFGNDLDGVSSVAADPLGRGFGVATLIPDNNVGTPGQLGIFDLNTGAVLGALDVGFHPDSVIFSQDASQIFVTNEGEWNNGFTAAQQAPGSISVIDLPGVNDLASASNLLNYSVTTVDFTGVDLTGVRSQVSPNVPGSAPSFDVPEPEYSVQLGSNLYVSLQEGNAVAKFDLNTNSWSDVFPLGSITQTIDASDRDGGILIDDVVAGLPMPDALAAFSIGGQDYFVTANEGDALNEDERIKDITLDPTLFPDAATLQQDENLGRLEISTLDGDIDGDGDFDALFAYGTRSITVWNADTGDLVFDTGALESLLLTVEPNPNFHNMNAEPGDFDERSDNKGPEPEFVTVFERFGRTFIAALNERHNSILLFEAMADGSLMFFDYLNSTNAGNAEPESAVFIPSEESPTGEDLLVVGYEDSGTIEVIAVVVPEPGTLALIAVFGLGGLVLLRRRLNRR